MTPTIQLTKDLVRIASVTPDDKGAQDLLIKRLEKIGFSINKLRFGQVDNFWAQHGTQTPLLGFAGHTDVVPVGDETSWTHPPFIPVEKDGLLYGRGVADMKGGIAAFVVAVERFVADNPNHAGSIGFLITSDEEGIAVDGTVKVMAWLKDQGIKMDYCLVGEPSSTNTVGDVIKNGRRGSLNGKLTIIGKQGHIAYPHLANNPIHLAMSVLDKLCQHSWDEGNEYFPATSFQISNIKSGAGTTNVIPGTLEAVFNFRYCTEQTHTDLQNFVEKTLDDAGIEFSLEWTHSGHPFLTPKGHLVSVCSNAIKAVTGTITELSTSGGTSDGRFIALAGTQVIELGVCNATIHQVDECASIDDLNKLCDIYLNILENFAK